MQHLHGGAGGGFVERATGRFHDVALITSDRALQEFRERYGIEGELRKIY